jgi:hypothetical protein
VGFAVLLPSARGHRLGPGQDLTGSAVPADVALLLSHRFRIAVVYGPTRALVTVIVTEIPRNEPNVVRQAGTAARDPRLRAVSIGELNPTRSAGEPDAIPRFVRMLSAALSATASLQ